MELSFKEVGRARAIFDRFVKAHPGMCVFFCECLCVCVLVSFMCVICGLLCSLFHNLFAGVRCRRCVSLALKCCLAASPLFFTLPFCTGHTHADTRTTHTEAKTYIKWAKFETKQGNRSGAREVFECVRVCDRENAFVCLCVVVCLTGCVCAVCCVSLCVGVCACIARVATRGANRGTLHQFR